MKLSQSVKPISYIKANAAEIIKNFSKYTGTMVITRNGESKAIVQDIKSYEKTQESLALLKILAQGRKEIERGEVWPAKDVIKELEDSLDEEL